MKSNNYRNNYQRYLYKICKAVLSYYLSTDEMIAFLRYQITNCKRKKMSTIKQHYD